MATGMFSKEKLMNMQDFMCFEENQPGIEAGDIIIEVQIQPNENFKRKGADLYMEKTISLYEALAGTRFEIQHLDGRKLIISTPKERIVGHGEVLCLEEIGMPFFGRSYKYGNLFITFSVDFPQNLSEAQMKTARDCLKNGEIRVDPNVTGKAHQIQEFKGTVEQLLAKLNRQGNFA